MLLTEGASGRSGSKPGNVRAEPDGDGDDAAGVSGSAMAGPPCARGGGEILRQALHEPVPVPGDADGPGV